MMKVLTRNAFGRRDKQGRVVQASTENPAMWGTAKLNGIAC